MRRHRPRERDVAAPMIDFLRVMGANPKRKNVGKFKLAYTSKKTGIAKFRWVCFGDPGECDWQWIVPDGSGRHGEMEAKRPGEWPTPEQINYMIYMNSLGCIAFWADDLDQVRRVFRAAMRGGRVVMARDGTYGVEYD
jgi:hypothetical protein